MPRPTPFQKVLERLTLAALTKTDVKLTGEEARELVSMLLKKELQAKAPYIGQKRK